MPDKLTLNKILTNTIFYPNNKERKINSTLQINIAPIMEAFSKLEMRMSKERNVTFTNFIICMKITAIGEKETCVNQHH